MSAGAFRVVLRYLYTTELSKSGEGRFSAGGGTGEGSSVGGERRGGKGKGKGDNGKGKGILVGDGGKSKGNREEETRRQVLEREVFKVADLFRLEVLLEYWMEAFSPGLKVDTVMDGPAEVRKVVTEYFVRNDRRIWVGTIFVLSFLSHPFTLGIAAIPRR